MKNEPIDWRKTSPELVDEPMCEECSTAEADFIVEENGKVWWACADHTPATKEEAAAAEAAYLLDLDAHVDAVLDEAVNVALDAEERDARLAAAEARAAEIESELARRREMRDQIGACVGLLLLTGSLIITVRFFQWAADTAAVEAVRAFFGGLL